MKRLFQRGFTLIELLIVVAIIAILAAIAVPNFLEAQTRAKVSRAKADMRSLATAIEAKAVDDNKYIPDAEVHASFLPRLVPLTTPIAYITSVFEDPFAEGGIIDADDPGNVFDDAYRIPYASGELTRPYPFDYANRFRLNGDDEEALFPGLWTERISESQYVVWALRSIGPDNTPTFLGLSSARVYDPTNGTTSFGDIFYLGSGVGFGGPIGP
jgi:prepilin-type N-terminal cleavage/methylation domain-containing protein